MTQAFFDVFGKKLNAEEMKRLVLGEVTGKLETVGKLNPDDLVARKLLEKALSWKWIFKLIPFVEGVSVCNLLPLGIAAEESDIDLFVITKAGRIFTAKFFLTIILQILGLRRHGRKVKGRFCLSFYCAEDALSLDKILLPEMDIYLAYWMIANLPVYGSRELWAKFICDNENWIGRYFGADVSRRMNVGCFSCGKDLFKRMKEWLLEGRIGEFLENILKRHFSRQFEKRKALFSSNASVIVSSEMLKYHNNDRRRHYQDQFEQNLG